VDHASGNLTGPDKSDVTASDGSYNITGIPPGTYDVREVIQAGWTCTEPNAAGIYYDEVFTSSDQITDNDFGNFLIWDEEALDNDFHDVERAAAALGVTPDELVNDDRPTEGANPALLWNILRDQWTGPTDINDPEYKDRFVVRIPTGQDTDEGWYVLPEEIQYDGLSFGGLTDGNGNVIDDQAWIEDLIAGTLPQSQLDKIFDVQPLRDLDLITMVGHTCTALVWDSDISMNYNDRRTANLQGARYGLFTFKILDIVKPQASNSLPAIPESTSSTSFFDVILEVLPPPEYYCPTAYRVNNVLLPDTVEIKDTSCRGGVLTINAQTSNRNADLYIAIEDLITAESRTMMTPVGTRGKFKYEVSGVDCSTLMSKVITVYSDGNGDPLAPIAFGSGGTYNERLA
jgi:hypothetical protein